MNRIEFWLIGLAGVGVAYTYFGYPAALAMLGVFKRRRAPEKLTEWPAITVTLPVYNEEAVIAGTLDQILAIDYPAERRQVLVISDASTDRTDEIVGTYRERGVELVRLPERAGKGAGENLSREYVRGEIVVTTDASVRIDRDALKPLIASFRDQSVGVASGRDVSVGRLGEVANVGESGYVGYEMWVRHLETRVSGIVGASGCFSAIRKDVHAEFISESMSRDFAAPLVAKERGLRSVSVNEAICYVPRAPSLKREYRRKVRTMARGLRTLFYKRHLMNPFRYGVFAWMLFSHKLMRWLVPWLLVVAVLAVVVVSVSEPWGIALLGLLAVPSLLAMVGWLWPAGRPLSRVVAIAAYGVAGTIAAIHWWFGALRADSTATWEPTARSPIDTP